MGTQNYKINYKSLFKMLVFILLLGNSSSKRPCRESLGKSLYGNARGAIYGRR